jgi:hypothetical protein
MMRNGVRAHDFGKLPSDELAGRIAAKGLSCVQLAVSKAIAGLDPEAGDMTPGWRSTSGRRSSGTACRSPLGCYVNLIHPDLSVRGSLLGLSKSTRATRAISDAALSPPRPGPSTPTTRSIRQPPEQSFQTLPSVAALVEEAEKWGVIVGVEESRPTSPRRRRRCGDCSTASRRTTHRSCSTRQSAFERTGDQDRVIMSRSTSSRPNRYHPRQGFPGGGRRSQAGTRGRGQLQLPAVACLA